MLRKTVISAIALTLCTTPALAAQDKPFMDRDPDAVDVVKTPVTDLNIDKQEIPQILLAAQNRPYDLTGLGRCGALADQVNALDDLLGPDLDLPEQQRSRISPGRVAKTVVGSFIPFRGLIREVSGANEHDRQVRAAIQAGLARRGFLKGVGQARNCPYPARPANGAVVAAYIREQQAQEAAEKTPVAATPVTATPTEATPPPEQISQR